MASPIVLELRVRLKWWVKPYLFCVAMKHKVIRTEPDVDRVFAHVKSGIELYQRSPGRRWQQLPALL